MKKLTLKISEIKNNPNNPRLIKDDKFKKLVQSIKEFPEMLDTREIVVNKDHIILGGNMRFKAAKEAGLKEVPVKIVDWDEDKQRQFIIKDNVAGGEWDWDMMANEWDADELADWGLDLPADWAEETEIEEDEAPEVSDEPPVSKLGEVYQLGRHRVMCADSTVKENVELLMNGEKADMVFTDPPYNLLDHKIETGITCGDWIPVIQSAIKGDAIVVWTCQQPFASEWTVAFLGYGFKYMNEIIWHKKVSSSGFAEISRVHENMFIFAQGNARYSETKVSYDEWLEHIDYNKIESLKRELSAWKAKAQGREVKDDAWYKKNGYADPKSRNGDEYYKNFNTAAGNTLNSEYKTISTVWDIMRDTSNSAKNGTRQESMHVTQKPLELIARAIRMCSSPYSSVLDLFLGSGSTLIACEQTDRTCYGMELDPKYVDVIRKRYHKFVTGNEEGWEDGTPAI